ncbi:putative sulfate exporter family transporter [Rhodovastum atsumiense]|uniref:Putative sulfate exporter family transporter n=1 Tax=Rhodovastum atsumiense TaxID=504468 RepID=A0A5M6IWC9_9PROT|nr:putative sulfate exporter family transporter [Rhodovastum atsumiense]KAA5612279.1 putative sulfate exporter family transporter [Rhodovastum atsumiense]CAH2601608.1 putative sulfate exporter family transporter [Rhodovastum atsumiense]
MSGAVAADGGPVGRGREDWLAAGIGLALFLAALAGTAGTDLLGWVVTTAVWIDPTGALAPAARTAWGWLGGGGALLATWGALLVLLTLAAAATGARVGRFALAFSVLFALAYGSWFLGSHARLAAVTPAELKKFGLDWSLKLTSEGGFLIALVAGLVIANAFPRFAEWLKEAARPELYIKIAIVLLGGVLATAIAGKLGFASSLLLRGIAAIVEAYLIYWAVVYFVARRWFGFSREWAAPLASGISICGVAAAIATGGAIRSRPGVPVLVSSLVVVFAVVEVLLLPFLAQAFLADQPLVAAAWMGLAVKTDGAAVAAGGITEALLLSQAAAGGVNWQAGWILGTTAAVKIFIDVFISVWAFILAYVWTNHINVQPGQERARPIEIWHRFPKFILGFIVTFAVALALSLSASPAQIATPVAEANTLRVIFFLLTFFSIGLLSNFRKLWEEGLGKLALVYVVSLFGFVIWVGLAISWIFFHGVTPPLAS